MASAQLIAHRFEDKQRSDDVKVQENIDFSALLLSQHVQDGLTKAGFVKPSPIQLQAIPLGKFGLDLIVQAKSGTGKTCIFAVIALENIVLKCTSVQTLVLAPTREIASQICEVVLSIGSSMSSLRCHYFIGGLPLAEDKVKLKQCHIAVGTPGRIKQLIECNYLKTNAIRLFVLDEADKLLDKEFQKPINWIYQKLPHNKQILALSATYPESLAKLLTNYMRSPAFVRLNTQKPTLLGVVQFYTVTKFHPLPHIAFQHKSVILQNILTNIPFSQCLIFINLQSRAQLLCDKLNKQGWASTYICGSQSQIQRLRTMAQLKSFQCRILVTTDLTARGIDCQNVDVVVNIDMPWDLETYLHRVGRAGRFGSKGLAITIVSEGSEKDSLFSMNLSASLDICELPQPLSPNIWNFDVKKCSQSIENGSDPIKSDSFISILNDDLLNNGKSVPEENLHNSSCCSLNHDESDALTTWHNITNSKGPDVELNGKSEQSEENGIYNSEGSKHCDVIHTVSSEELEKKYCNGIPLSVMNLKAEDNFQCIEEQNSGSIIIRDGLECLNELSSDLAKNFKLVDTNDESTENSSCQQESNSMHDMVNDLLHLYKIEPCIENTSYAKILEELENFEVGNEFCSSEQCDTYVPSKKLLQQVKSFLHHSNQQYWKCIEATVNNSNIGKTEQMELLVPLSSSDSDFKATSEKVFTCNTEIKGVSTNDYEVKSTKKGTTSLYKSKEIKVIEEKNDMLPAHNQLVEKTQIANDVEGADLPHNILEVAGINDLDCATISRKSQEGISDCVSFPVTKLKNYEELSSNAMILAENNKDTCKTPEKCSTSVNSGATKSCDSQYSDSEESTSSEDRESELESSDIEIAQRNYIEQVFVPDYYCSFPVSSQSHGKGKQYACNEDTMCDSSNLNTLYGNSLSDRYKSPYEHLSFTPDCWQRSNYGYSSANAENTYMHLYYKNQYTTNVSCKYCLQYNKHWDKPNFFMPTKAHEKFGPNLCYNCYWDQCSAASQNWCYSYTLYMSEMLRFNRSQRRCCCYKCCK